MTAALNSATPGRVPLLAFVLAQAVVMLVAISGESLWIDEFWTAHFAARPSFNAFMDLLRVPSGSQTPLHFLHFYLWGQLQLAGEYLLRLANLPLFLAGQTALYLALQGSPRTFSHLVLALGALHPLVWQYANEARPYIMMLAGAQMMMAYLLRLHACGRSAHPVEPLFLLFFVLGGILLFGASLLGAFWVLAASLWVLLQHQRQRRWPQLLRGVNPWLVLLMVVATASLSSYYLSSLIQGAGASRLASSTPATLLFAVYEVLGLAGMGPGRLELRSQGAAALAPYALALLVAAAVLLAVLAVGLKAAQRRRGTQDLLLMVALGLLPVLIVVGSGFVMHWRVLGRHLIAALPLLNLLLALGLATLLQGQGPEGLRGNRFRFVLAVFCLLVLAWSSASLRFSPRHSKDDYRAAAALAQAAFNQGQKVWWAADVIGARYYGLPGEFDVMGELTGQHQAPVCKNMAGVQAVPNLGAPCLQALSLPDLVILSKPETFDTQGNLSAYLKDRRFTVVQNLPAFTIWQRPAIAAPVKP